MHGLTKLLGWVLIAVMPIAALAEPAPTGKLPENTTPLSYTLNLKIDPREERFSGQVHIHVKLGQAADHVWLHAREIDVAKVEVIDAAGETHPAQFAMRDPSGVAEVSFGASLPAQDIELVFDYSAPFNVKLQGIYKVKVGDDAYVTSQFESISARYAFPGFDEPRFKVPFDITLTVPKQDVAIANTRQVSEKVSDDAKWKTLTFSKTKPLPTYLIAIAVGPWDVVDGPVLPANSVRKEAVPLRGVGPRGTGRQLKWILDETPAVVKFYEDYTHQPYPFDKLDLLGAPDFAAGAMENAGLIVYRDALLRIDAGTPANFYRISFDVNAHEIAHQWFGDLVTVPWWDDIWLNEAFATWAQAKTTTALKPAYLGDLARIEASLGAMRGDSLLSARKIRQPIKTQDDIENAFDGITYEKGAAVLRMFEEWVGEDTYREAMRDYLAKHAFGSGSSDDLIATIARVSGKGDALTKGMRSFLDQPGIPLVHSELTCEASKATLALSQSRFLPFGALSNEISQWSVPVCARFSRNGKSDKQCFLLDQPKRNFAVTGGCADWYVPNAEAAGYYRFTMSEHDFGALKAQVATLTPAEQAIFADAVVTGFRRGDIAPATVLDAMPVLANSEYPSVASALVDEFAWIREHLASDTTRPVLDAFASKLYSDRVAKLGLRHQPNETDATSRMRMRLVHFLAFDTRNPALRKQLNALGRDALGLDGGGKVDLAKLDPDTRGAALETVVQESGAQAFDAILAELKTNHETEQRYELLAAVGGAHDPKLAERARDYGLTPAVGVGELLYVYSNNIAQPENRAGFWTWFQAHYESLRTRLPDAYQSMLPRMVARGRCEKSQNTEMQTWFAPRIKDVIGGERALAQSLEGASQCASLREHSGEKSLANWAEEHAH
jgi:cytosol alanyl aminopeptidase